MKRFVFFLLTFLSVAVPVAKGNYVYITNSDDSILIIADPKATGSVDVPATLNGHPVTGIESFAFAGTGLTNVTIPASITSIGSDPFAECSNLAAISVAAQNSYYASTNGVLFDTRHAALVAYPAAKMGDYAIPDGIAAIDEFAFSLCEGLTNVTIPDSVKSIADAAFYFCTNLHSVTFPDSVSEIGPQAFEADVNITNLLFDGNAPTVSSSAFVSDVKATVEYMPGTSGWGAKLAGIPTVMIDAPTNSGSLQVTLLPATAAKSGATWQVDGGTPQPSGAVVLGLTAGNHVVSFNDGKDWSAPPNQTVTVTNNLITVASGMYVALGSLQVTITPAGIASGATWQVDGGAAQASGDTIYNLSIGEHVVSFNGVGGWVTPSNQTVAVHANATTHGKGTYILTAHGVYNGLFFGNDGGREETGGTVKNLALTPQGTYSGTLMLDGVGHTLTGSFDASGNASNYISRTAHAGGPLAVTMDLNWSASPPAITGAVSGTKWTAALTNYLAETSTNQAEYTFLLANGYPLGDGYLLVTNHDGVLTISGALADGTALSERVSISTNDQIPIYASLYNNTGLLLGWISLTTNSPSGYLIWIKNASHSALYPEGFTNLLNAQGSPWFTPIPPGPGGRTVTPEETLEVSGGNLLNPIFLNVDIIENNALVKVTGLVGGPTNSLSGSLNPKTGLLTVTFGNGDGKATTTGKGVILQNTEAGGGYFLGKTNTGSIVLTPN